MRLLRLEVVVSVHKVNEDLQFADDEPNAFFF